MRACHCPRLPRRRYETVSERSAFVIVAARLFDHVTIRASDREASKRFYGLVLRTIGLEPAPSDGYYTEWADFSVAAATDEKPPTGGLHIAFAAPSRSYVDEFWRVGTDAGYRDDGAPGPRPQYSESYYGAFLLDPDGNSAEAVHHDDVRSDGRHVDHLWIRVADVAAAKRFYELVASHEISLAQRTDVRSARHSRPSGVAPRVRYRSRTR